MSRVKSISHSIELLAWKIIVGQVSFAGDAVLITSMFTPEGKSQALEPDRNNKQIADAFF